MHINKVLYCIALKKESGAGKGPDFRIAALGKKWSYFRPAANSSHSAMLHFCVQTVVQPVSVYLNRTPVFEQVEPQFNLDTNNLSPSEVNIKIGPYTGALPIPFHNTLAITRCRCCRLSLGPAARFNIPPLNSPPGSSCGWYRN
jgi:hypothetical protein